MPDSLTPEALNTLRLPIVFTPGAWQRAVLLERPGHPEKLQVNRLSNVLRAAFEAHRAYPHEPYVLFEVAHICLLYTSPSPRDRQKSRMPSSA